MRIVLASASPRRRQLLQLVGLTPEILPADVDESIPGDLAPAEICRALAVRKADAAAERLRGDDGEWLVLAADTIVALGDEVLGKPSDPDEAAAMLTRLAGRMHRVFTGVAIRRGGGPGAAVEADVAHEETRVWMRPLTPAQIAAYVRSGEPLDKAGGYGVQGLGAILVERLEGCYYNVVGLPLSRVCRMLERHGVVILG